MKVIKWGLISIVVILCGSSLIIGVSTFIFLDSLSAEKAPQIVQSVGAQAAHSKIDTPRDLSGKEQALVSEQKVQITQDKIKTGMKFLSLLEELQSDPRLTQASPLCEILCAQSIWIPTKDRETRITQITEFVEKEGSRAFEDPKFRLEFEAINASAEMLSVMGKTLKILEPLRLRKHELSEGEKMALSAQAPFLLAQMVTQMKPFAEKSTEKRARVRELIKLRRQCHLLSQEEIESSCQRFIGR